MVPGYESQDGVGAGVPDDPAMFREASSFWSTSAL
jgi:hypothetical protein